MSTEEESTINFINSSLTHKNKRINTKFISNFCVLSIQRGQLTHDDELIIIITIILVVYFIPPVKHLQMISVQNNKVNFILFSRFLFVVF